MTERHDKEMYKSVRVMDYSDKYCNYKCGSLNFGTITFCRFSIKYSYMFTG